MAAAASGRPGERLAGQVYRQVLELMIEQKLQEGDRLPSEHELSRMAGVSRPIVREALTRLQADGLIEARRGAGSFLRKMPSARQVEHLRPATARVRLHAFQVRIALEPAAAGLAALHRSDDELEAIRAALSDLSAAHAALQPGGAHDVQLHRGIAAASHNPMFLHVLDAVNAGAEAVTAPSSALLAEGAAERALRVEQEHAAIVEAIARRDADCAEAAMRLHLTNARARAFAAEADAGSA